MSSEIKPGMLHHLASRRGPQRARETQVAHIPSEYAMELGERVRRSREGLPERTSQKDMADALGVEETRYAKWEGRSCIPHDFVGPFCRITSVHPWWLLTGQRGHLSPTGTPELNRRVS